METAGAGRHRRCVLRWIPGPDALLVDGNIHEPAQRHPSHPRDPRCDQGLRGLRGQPGHLDPPPRGRDRGPAGGERGRQVDPDEHPLRALPAHLRDGAPGRRAGALRLAARSHRPGPRHGAPALHARAHPDGDPEHHPGRRARAAGARAHPRSPRAGPRALRAFRADRGPGCPGGGSLRGAPAAGGDPEGPLPEGPGADPGRAHRRADALRGGGAVRRVATAGGERHGDHHHHPQAGGGPRPLPSRLHPRKGRDPGRAADVRGGRLHPGAAHGRPGGPPGGPPGHGTSALGRTGPRGGRRRRPGCPGPARPARGGPGGARRRDPRHRRRGGQRAA